MADKTTVTERGQTAIPARVRRESSAGPGTELIWEVVGKDEWRVTVVRIPLQCSSHYGNSNHC
jgi:bifunctional DNA-binding transcriptional regulator/antitoxin component of YhaV-PrlF toxin-antitoxin module